MKKAVLAISVMVVLLVAVSQAVAWCPMGRGFGYAANLKLTTEQSEKLNTLQQDFFKETLHKQFEDALQIYSL